jgi:hypothetical protein
MPMQVYDASRLIDNTGGNEKWGRVGGLVITRVYR